VFKFDLTFYKTKSQPSSRLSPHLDGGDSSTTSLTGIWQQAILGAMSLSTCTETQARRGPWQDCTTVATVKATKVFSQSLGHTHSQVFQVRNATVVKLTKPEKGGKPIVYMLATF
jgi:hypothetical protein